MKKWVKWALVAGGALLLFKTVKGGSLLGGLTGGADAPGVETGDVKYTAYKTKWDEAKAKGDSMFDAFGSLVFKNTAPAFSFRWHYRWNTFDGAFRDKTKRHVS